jgi:DNA topoisomerase-1
MPRLRRVRPGGPGITRRKRGRGFEYRGVDGQLLTDEEALARIQALVIPPAWTDVWICPFPNGHIQALGTDAAGRRQYLYHPAWRVRRDAEKFDKMLDFARSLPMVRTITNEHLAREGMPRERSLACCVRLLDSGFFRIGGETYAETNNSYGLATMRKEHVKLGRSHDLVFEYVAKSGKEQVQSFVDPKVYDVVATLKRRRTGGIELFAYQADGMWRDVKSADINAYLKEVAGAEYSAKDFRTWHATVYAAKALAVSVEANRSDTARKRAITRAVTEVAHYLGNTPTVCRNSYIDPRVIDRYRAGETIIRKDEVLDAFGDPAGRELLEAEVLALLEEHPASATKAA